MTIRQWTQLVAAPLALAAGVIHAPFAAADLPAWKMGGQNLSNSRNQPDEKRISAESVHGLAPRWVVATDGDVSATPAVVDGALYVPDWAGKLYKIDTRSGATLWKVTLPAVSRITPAVVGNQLIVPLQGLPPGGTCAGVAGGACVLSINATTGAITWQSRIDDFPTSYVTQSPVVSDQRVYVGVTSAEESLTGLVPGYACCSFRGSIVALDLDSGALQWKTYTVPDGAGLPFNERYAGAGVWGSTPVVDKKRNLLFVGTGNNYNIPESVKLCFMQLTDTSHCDTATNNHVDAIMALDLQTGAVRWARSFAGRSGYNWPPGLQGYDAWNLSCIAFIFPGGNTSNCPAPVGPDFDFAQGPMLLKTHIGGRPRDLLVAGQKSGVFWALDPDDGNVVWATVTGPGGVAGGMQWGSATDGTRIYFANSNSGNVPVSIGGVTTRSGFWGALDARNGAVLWMTADPNLYSGPYGAVTVANGVVFAGSNGGPSPIFTGGTIPWDYQTAPSMFALDARTGQVRWSYAAGGSVLGGAAVVNGAVYWGSGYANFGVGVANRRLYAFETR